MAHGMSFAPAFSDNAITRSGASSLQAMVTAPIPKACTERPYVAALAKPRIMKLADAVSVGASGLWLERNAVLSRTYDGSVFPI